MVVNYVLTQSQVAATTPKGVISNLFVQQTFNQMKVIAREAYATPADHDLIVCTTNKPSSGIWDLLPPRTWGGQLPAMR